MSFGHVHKDVALITSNPFHVCTLNIHITITRFISTYFTFVHTVQYNIIIKTAEKVLIINANILKGMTEQSFSTH